MISVIENAFMNDESYTSNEYVNVSEACSDFLLESTNLVNDLNMKILLNEHKYLYENGHELEYTDEYGYLTEAGRSFKEWIEETWDKFLKFWRELFRKAKEALNKMFITAKVALKKAFLSKKHIDARIERYFKSKTEAEFMFKEYIDPEAGLNAVSQIKNKIGGITGDNIGSLGYGDLNSENDDLDFDAFKKQVLRDFKIKEVNDISDIYKNMVKQDEKVLLNREEVEKIVEEVMSNDYKEALLEISDVENKGIEVVKSAKRKIRKDNREEKEDISNSIKAINATINVIKQLGSVAVKIVDKIYSNKISVAKKMASGNVTPSKKSTDNNPVKENASEIFYGQYDIV